MYKEGDNFDRQTVVSIIMPVYNAEKYLKRTIESIAKQTFSKFELIAVDDGSKDESVRILHELSNKYSFLKIVEKANGGPSSARNVGLQNAHGKWIQFMDSDDTLDESMLQTMYNASTKLAADMIICGFYEENLEQCVEVCLENRTIENLEQLKKFFLSMDIRHKAICMNYLWNRWIRADIILNNKIKFREDIRLGEDFVFLASVLKETKSISIIEKPLYHYMTGNENSLVHQFSREEATRRSIMRDAFCDCMDHYGILNQMTPFIDYNEGKYAIEAIGKVNCSACDLKIIEKKNYIETLMSDDLWKCEIWYLSTQKDIKSRIKKLAIKSKLPWVVLMVWTLSAKR